MTTKTRKQFNKYIKHYQIKKSNSPPNFLERATLSTIIPLDVDRQIN